MDDEAPVDLHSIQSCPRLIEAHAKQRDHEAYLVQDARARMQVEYRVARCLVRAGSTEEALALAAGWTGKIGDAFRSMLHARVASRAGEPEAVRKHLLAWIETGLARSRVLLEDPELRTFIQQPWYAELTLAAWKRELAEDRAPPLHELVERLAREMGVSTTELRVASADPEMAVGALAIWQGEVVEARVDRDRGRTLLLVQGFDVEQVLVDRQERVVKRTAQPMYGGWVAVPSLVEVVDSYKEVFRLNGRLFGVVIDGIDEDVIRMPRVVVVGVVSLHGESLDPDSDVRSIAYREPLRPAQLVRSEVPFLKAKLVLPRETRTLKKTRHVTP